MIGQSGKRAAGQAVRLLTMFAALPTVAAAQGAATEAGANRASRLSERARQDRIAGAVEVLEELHPRGHRVRGHGVGDGLVLVEGLSWSHCTSEHNEASVTCRDDGVCAGTGPQVASFDDLRRYGSDVVEASLSVPVGMPDSFPTYN